jgi:hypothetical protein
MAGAATAADSQVQPQLARQWFEEATKLCERDAGRLWGVSLCGPMVIFDQATGTRATSQPEPDGPLPRFPGYADGPVHWGGTRWFSWPLYMLADKTADERQQMMLHGLFHRIQADLGFTPSNGFNEHLDTVEGRVWMQLEWRALRRALESTGSNRDQAIADALAFRRERRRLFPGAAENERREEIKEGLPSYTGIADWANSPAAARYDAATLRTAEEARDRARQSRVADLRRRFVDGPVRTMPAAGSTTSDSTGAPGIPGVGTVFFTISPFWLHGAALTPRAASCALPMGPPCLCPLPRRSKGPHCGETAGAPL